MSDEIRVNEKEETGETIICPICDGYGYLDEDMAQGSPCTACCGSGSLTKSCLEEWEIENSPVEWTDENT